ncbi:MAG: hypothetical protein J6L96_05360 [Clostridia bacterium]|nr:hypothetical protein [Clostridia bacterium]
MKLKKILLDSLILVVILVIAGLLCSFVCSWVFVLPVKALSTNELIARLTYFVPYFISMLAVLFVFSYKKEYKRENFVLWEAVASGVIACGIQLILPFVLTFVEYTVGPALPLGKIIFAGADINKPLLNYEVPGHIYALCMLLLDVFYIISTVLGSRAGQKKRQSERDKLCGNGGE